MASYNRIVTKASVLAVASFCAFGVLACSGDEQGPTGVSINPSALSSYAADWDGYAEALTFRSGTDRVRITLDANGSGWLQVGDGELLPPPTDAGVGYPSPATDPFDLNLYDRVRYPIEGARVQSQRIRFDFDAFAGAYADWCALQKPLQRFNTNGYGCTAEASVGNPNPDGTCTTRDSENGPEHPIDCMKLLLCNGACACDETSCSNAASPLYRIDAALSADGQDLEGTVLVPAWSGPALPYTLRLKRMSTSP